MKCLANTLAYCLMAALAGCGAEAELDIPPLPPASGIDLVSLDVGDTQFTETRAIYLSTSDAQAVKGALKFSASHEAVNQETDTVGWVDVCYTMLNDSKVEGLKRSCEVLWDPTSKTFRFDGTFSPPESKGDYMVLVIFTARDLGVLSPPEGTAGGPMPMGTMSATPSTTILRWRAASAMMMWQPRKRSTKPVKYDDQSGGEAPAIADKYGTEVLDR